MSSPSKYLFCYLIFPFIYQMPDILIYHYTSFPERMWLLHTKRLKPMIGDLGVCGGVRVYDAFWNIWMVCNHIILPNGIYFNTIRPPLSILNNSCWAVTCVGVVENSICSIDVLCCLWLLNTYMYTGWFF